MLYLVTLFAFGVVHCIDSHELLNLHLNNPKQICLCNEINKVEIPNVSVLTHGNGERLHCLMVFEGNDRASILRDIFTENVSVKEKKI